MAIPTPDEIEASGAESTKYTAFEILNSKYNTANDWARWAAELLQADISQLTAANNAFDISPIIADGLASIQALIDYVPGTVPAYIQQTLGTLLGIPTPSAVVLPSAPATTAIAYTPTGFSDALHTALCNRLIADIETSHTGLGSAEDALFARETARVSEMRAIAYAEVTAAVSAGGFPVPTGALLAKQTEMNNETSNKLTDSSASIMAESARLAQDYNKHVLSVSQAVDALLVEVWNSAENRLFEKAKEDVIQSIAVFLAEVQGALGKAGAETAYINAINSYNDGVVKVFEANVRGQIANIQGAAMYEDVKLKAYSENVKKALAASDLHIKLSTAEIDAAVRNYGMNVSTLQGMAQAASQMVASALNGVNVSSGFSWSGSTGYNLSDNDNLNVARGDVSLSQSTIINE